MLYQAADTMLDGEDVTLQASMLKLKIGRLAREITDSCLQFWGGMGFTNEVYVSRDEYTLRQMIINNIFQLQAYNRVC